MPKSTRINRRDLVWLALLLTSQLITACGESPDIPDADNFRPFMLRDVRACFVKRRADIPDLAVQYELFRNGPTITGIAFPKYYAWARLFSKDTLIDEGAVRIAAIHKHFEVTDFIDKKQILSNPNSVGKVFPAALCAGIIAKAKDTDKAEQTR